MALNGSDVGASGDPASPSGLRLQPRLRQGANNHDSLEVDVEWVLTARGLEPRGEERLTCVLRDVGTFDPADQQERSGGAVCAGALGYNPPSLLGVFTTPPYFHSGKAATLADVFSPRFATHTNAGNPTQAPLDAAALEALVAFVSSIDQHTPTFAVPPDAELCTQR
jgi:hypothetical protein